jgi:hypothetical protein
MPFFSTASKVNYCRRLVSKKKKNCQRGNSVFLLQETEIKACNGYGAAQKGTVLTTLWFVLLA